MKMLFVVCMCAREREREFVLRAFWSFGWAALLKEIGETILFLMPQCTHSPLQ